jgi:hypothetical protein
MSNRKCKNSGMNTCDEAWMAEFGDSIADLEPQLLAIGGTSVSSQPYNLVDLIADAGERMTFSVSTTPMEWARCHWNVARLWAEGRLDRVCTGYALGGDGVWHPHCWGISGNRTIETTREMDAYFGVDLSSAEADLFAERSKEHYDRS